MLPLFASFAIAAAIGLVLVWGLMLRRLASLAEVVLVASLAVALGLGVTGSAWFFWLLIAGPQSSSFLFFDFALVVGITAAVLWLSRRGRLAISSPQAPAAGRPGVPRLLSWSFAAVSAVAAAGFYAVSRLNPHGGWDAWMTWNMHARFIFRGGDGWLTLFSESSPLRHPDYPFLLPTLVARGWIYSGAEHWIAPVLVALLFTAATVALVCSALALLRSPSQGLLAGLVLVSTPFFISHGASQYADVPLGLYFTAVFVLLCLHDHARGSSHGPLILAGLAAGLAAWTKNEGLLFLLALVLARSVVAASRRAWRTHARELVVFSAGLLPIVLLILYFKLALAPANDIVSSSAQGLQTTLSRVTDPERLRYVAGGFKHMFSTFGGNGFVAAGWLLLTYLICVGVRGGATSTTGIRTAVLTVPIVLCGHVFVYLSTPGDMQRLLDASLERLLLQLWPGVLFVYFMIAQTPEEASAPAVSAEAPPLIVLADPALPTAAANESRQQSSP